MVLFDDLVLTHALNWVLFEVNVTDFCIGEVSKTVDRAGFCDFVASEIERVYFSALNAFCQQDKTVVRDFVVVKVDDFVVFVFIEEAMDVFHMNVF